MTEANGEEFGRRTLTLSGPWYDRLKFVSLIVLPASAALYLALAGLWNLPEPERVAGTITAVDTFLGVLLGLSTKNYNKLDDGVGTMLVSKAPEGYKLSLELNEDPIDIVNKKSVTFKVRS